MRGELVDELRAVINDCRRAQPDLNAVLNKVRPYCSERGSSAIRRAVESEKAKLDALETVYNDLR